MVSAWVLFSQRFNISIVSRRCASTELEMGDVFNISKDGFVKMYVKRLEGK